MRVMSVMELKKIKNARLKLFLDTIVRKELDILKLSMVKE